MWFNNSPEAGNWLIDKCAEFGVVPVSFRAHAPNAIIPESYDYHMFVNVGDHQFDSKCGYFAATNVLYEDSQNAEKYEHPATYFFNTKAQELLVEDGRVTGVFAQRDGELWLFRATKGVILATDGKISDIVVNSHAESSDIGARFSRIKDGYQEYVVKNVNRMIEADKVIQLSYPWKHPAFGEVTVRCCGKRVEDSDGMITLEGYHRITSNIEQN